MEVDRENAQVEELKSLDPQEIAAIFGTTARISGYDIWHDMEDNNRVVSKEPVWEIDIVDPQTLESLALFIKPKTSEVSVVSLFPHPAVIDLIKKDLLAIDLNDMPEGVPMQTALIENVQKIQIQRWQRLGPGFINVVFIAKEGDTEAKLQVNSQGKFRASFERTDDERKGKYALSVQEVEEVAKPSLIPTITPRS